MSYQFTEGYYRIRQYLLLELFFFKEFITGSQGRTIEPIGDVNLVAKFCSPPTLFKAGWDDGPA